MTEKDNPRRSRRSSGAITLRDVAKLAGVAPITASRVMNTPDQVSPEVRQRVLDAVQRTGYVPNRMAGGLASARSRLIAAVVPSTVMSVFMETIEALNSTLFDAGYQLMLGQSGYSADREELLLEAIIGRRPDGIFLTGIMGAGKGRTRLVASGIPVVETWDLTPTPIDMLVGFSNEEIGSSVCTWLYQRGYRRPALISGQDTRAQRRNASFLRQARSLGLGTDIPVCLTPPPTTLGAGRATLAELLARPGGVDAVFCSSDMLALGVMVEAQARGIRVPNQLGVVGLGDLEFAANLDPALTTVRIDGSRIGETAARYIVDRAEGRTVEQPIVDIGFSIIERGSA